MQPTKSPEVTAARPRTWLSLVTHRWYLSSRVVMVLTLLFLVFCNVPGQWVIRIGPMSGGRIEVQNRIEHGWPYTWLSHAKQPIPINDPFGDDPFGDGSPPKLPECFDFPFARGQFSVWAMVGNGILLVGLSLAAGVMFEGWRRARARIWQVTLLDMGIMMVAVAVGGTWYGRAVQQHAREEAARREDPVVYCGVGMVEHELIEEGGITWVRKWWGDKPFQFLDRKVKFDIQYGSDWSKVNTYSSARNVKLLYPATTSELAGLGKLSKLEAIWIHVRGQLENQTPLAELPRLPQVRYLRLDGPVKACRGLDRLPALEGLEISHGPCDRRTLKEIAGLRKLSDLGLEGIPRNSDLSFLPTLPRLERLTLSACELSEANLQSIGECRGLRFLSLERSQAFGQIADELSRLAGLEELSLQDARIDDRDLSGLTKLTKLRQLDLNCAWMSVRFGFVAKLPRLERLTLFSEDVNTTDLSKLERLTSLRSVCIRGGRLGSDCLKSLQQLKQLSSLHVDFLTIGDQIELAQSLPNCDVTTN